MDLIFGRRFAPLFWTQFLGALNDNIFKNALIILITYREVHVFGLAPGLAVALASGLFILPFFLFSAQAGLICDHFSKARVMRWTKIWEIVVMTLAGILLYLESFSGLIFVLFLMGSQSSYFGPAKYSIIPDLTEGSKVLKANALVETGTFISILLGLMLGNVLAKQGMPMSYLVVTIIVVAILGYLTSLAIPSTPVHEMGSKDKKISWGLWQSTRTVLRDIQKYPEQRLAIHGISWFWFVGALTITLLPLYSREVLRVDELVATSFLMAFVIGIALGAAVVARLASKHAAGLEVLARLGLICMSIFLFLVGSMEIPTLSNLAGNESLLGLQEFYGLGRQAWIFVIALLGVAAMGAIYTVPLYSKLQTDSDPGFRSRVIGANNILNALYMVSSAVILMILQALGFGYNRIFVLLALANIGFAFFYTSWIKKLPRLGANS